MFGTAVPAELVMAAVLGPSLVRLVQALPHAYIYLSIDLVVNTDAELALPPRAFVHGPDRARFFRSRYGRPESNPEFVERDALCAST